MSVPRPGTDRQPLLPATVEHSLNDLAIRFAGGALVAFAVTSWLALLSWQLRDKGAGRAARNLLGTFGAGLSDMMVHTLGIAVVFALICPMVWGLELLSSVRWISRFRLKLVAATGGVLALAGVASGLPAVPGWPLHGGSGGMLGDLAYSIAMSLSGRGPAETDSRIVIAALAGLGLVLLVKSLGLGRQLLGGLGLPAFAKRPKAAAAPDAPAATGTKPARPLAGDATTARPEPIKTAPARASVAVAETRDEPMPDEADEADDNAARAFAERFAPGVATGKGSAKARLVTAALETALKRARSETPYRKPSLNLLRRGNGNGSAAGIDVETGAATLLEILSAFGVKGEIREARSGPVVTRYELEPVRGTKITRVISLADDFARELGVNAVRVSVAPGRTTIGIEVPNERRETVPLRDILESETFTAPPHHLPLALGKGIAGEPVVLDLARMPHLLVAGTTGSGKSVGLNAMILSLVYRLEPSELRLLLIDPKMLELAQYDRIPHLLNPVITDPQEAAGALEWAVSEMDERYRRMASHSTRNIEAFNAKVRAAKATGVAPTRTVQTGFDPATGRAIYERQQLDDAPMPYIVIVIDELADLMVMAGRRVETAVQRLAQKARAAGIHLVMATQRPSVDVVTGTIKANFPVRLSFRVASKIDSRTIINEPGAEQLLGHGDMLLTSGAGHHLRVHGAYIADEEIERVADALRDQGEPQYVELLGHRQHVAEHGRARNAAKPRSAAAATARHLAETYVAAVAVVAGDRKVSPGHLHRRLDIPQELAGELIARMEAEGLVGPVNLIGRRTIHIEAPATPRARSRSAA